MKPILTRKQTMVFALVVRGWRNRAIAKALVISVKGVKYHKTNIFKLFGVGSTEQLLKKHARGLRARSSG